VARLATTHEKLVTSGPNPVALATPQLATSSPELPYFGSSNGNKSTRQAILRDPGTVNQGVRKKKRNEAGRNFTGCSQIPV